MLDACRACTAKDPARRIANAEAAGRLLTERRAWWARRPRRRRRRSSSRACSLIAAAVVGARGAHAPKPQDARTPAPSDSPLIVPTGEPADWTDVSTVLAEVPDRIHCTRLLPDQRTVRFVWGTPARAEDVDISRASACRRRWSRPPTPRAAPTCRPTASASSTRATPPTAAPSRSFRTSGRKRRRRRRSHRRTVDVIRADLARRQRHLLVRRRSETHGCVLDGGGPHEDPSRSHGQAVRDVVQVREREPDLRRDRLRDRRGGDFRIWIPDLTVGPKFRRAARCAFDLRSAGRPLLREHAAGTDSGWWRPTSRPRGARAGSPARPGDPVSAVHVRAGSRSSACSSARPWSSTGRTARAPWKAQYDVHAAARCGPDIVVCGEGTIESQSNDSDADGRFIATLTSGPWDTDPGCSPDGRSFSTCDRRTTLASSVATRRLPDDRRAPGYEPGHLPDGKRLALVSTDGQEGARSWRSPTRRQSRSRADGNRDRVPTGLGFERYALGRAAARSRRRLEGDRRRHRPGDRPVRPRLARLRRRKARPHSPAQRDVRVVYEQTSQLRFLPKAYLSVSDR